MRFQTTFALGLSAIISPHNKTRLLRPYPHGAYKMYHYKSEATQFLDKLIEDNPQLETQRLENRHLLWDVELNPQEQAEFEAAKVAKKPYTNYQD